MKYSWEFKLESVEKYLNGKWAENPDSTKANDEGFHNRILEWVRIYKLYGAEGLKHKPLNKEWKAE